MEEVEGGTRTHSLFLGPGLCWVDSTESSSPAVYICQPLRDEAIPRNLAKVANAQEKTTEATSKGHGQQPSAVLGSQRLFPPAWLWELHS